jgi:ferredoxin
MFGIIPYGLRLQYHRQYFRNEVFSRMLVDILSAAPPHLNVMDGVVAMEGEGPAAGHLRSVGALLASRDAVALDAVATKIAGFNPLDVYTTRNGWERGLGEARLTHIQVLGAPLRSVETRDFEHSAIASHLFRSRLPSIFYAYFEGQMVLTPEVRQEKCTSCGECVRTCPTGASRLTKRNAWIDKRQCIHCMCCHEVCRDNAIRLRQRPFGWIFRKSAALSRWI